MNAIEAISWLSVPTQVRDLVKAAFPLASRAQEALRGEPPVTLRIQPEDQLIVAPVNSLLKLSAHGLMATHDPLDQYLPGPWLTVKSADLHASDLLHPSGQAAGMIPAAWNKPLGGPSPLVGMLASGALGAGGGYLLGRGLEAWLPERAIGPGGIRRTTALLGGMAGATLPFYSGLVGMRHPENADNPLAAWVRPNVMFGSVEKPASCCPEKIAHELNLPAPDPGFSKAAEEAGGIFLRAIPVDDFNRVIMQDPFAPLQVKATAAGIVEAASQSLGGYGLVSPFDIARTLANAGVGYLTGVAIGKTLGALAGMTPQAQTVLQGTGAMAGVLRSVIPYGR